MPAPAIELKNLTKKYAGRAVVSDLNIEIPRGAIYGFLGPNGTGKSTTIRMMTGIIAPDDGDAMLLGKSIRRDAVAAKRMIGVVPDELALFEQLTVWEHLDLIRSVYEIDEAAFLHRSGQLLELLDLASAARKLARHCSYGMRKKLALAMALLPNPAVLILDEPFEGLDPVMCVTVKQALRRAAGKGTTVFLTTHLLHAVNDLLDHYGILREGVLVAQGECDSLARQNLSIEDEYLKHFPQAESGGLEWLG